MKICKISTSQFAGLRKSSVSLTDGINTICANNESGKSTFVNLLSHTLFKSPKLHAKHDKAFIDRFFPAKQTDAFAGDFIDGKVAFEVEGEVYTLIKTWLAKGTGSCELITPSVSLRDPDAIEAALRSLLVYGSGIYYELLFPSQADYAASLKALLDAAASTDAKDELAKAAAKALSESGGVTSEMLRSSIEEKINTITGKHWNAERAMPVFRPGNKRWSKEIGPIHEAYYALEDAKKTLQELSSLEEELSAACFRHAELKQELERATAELERFRRYSGMISLSNERKKRILSLQEEVDRLSNAAKNWPVLTEKRENALRLLRESEQRDLLDLYEKAKELRDELTTLSSALEAVTVPGSEQLAAANALQKEIDRLELQLRMDIGICIKMLGSQQAEVRKLVSNELIPFGDGRFSVSESVSVTVPGVMEMTLAPASVDADEIRQRIKAKSLELGKFLAEYGVDSVSALVEVSKKAEETSRRISSLESRLQFMLDGKSYESLESEALAITDPVRSAQEIRSDAVSLGVRTELSSFIARLDASIEDLENQYGSQEALRLKLSRLEEDLTDARSILESMSSIPAEYTSVSDPESHLKMLERNVDSYREHCEAALSEKVSNSTALEHFKQELSCDPKAEVERCTFEFERQMAMLRRWTHILRVLDKIDSDITASPLQDLADSFTHNLSILTGGRDISDLPKNAGLAVNIYSNGARVNYDALSEGTKEAVFLAFRLAVLDHLFPEGGVLVLDDPLTNMDDERRLRSCEMIREYGSRHQIIFLTCSNIYEKLLNGSRVQIERGQ